MAVLSPDELEGTFARLKSSNAAVRWKSIRGIMNAIADVMRKDFVEYDQRLKALEARIERMEERT